ncbi:DNA helicase RecQ [Bythopirellula polymerisocia]|uniref:DNA helicase RecQ n=1 Tax=Bythopirellula polymerisocia TaxID=2528003 RepID=A0A5C6CI60_9BACT|nr:DNA helicase RecQ [Bythopirellula polymerisocia]TWU24503.1 ATP-dependent DNA helicase RecQ [Bythopirellula polymerisocia]
MSHATASTAADQKLLDALRRYWGYDEFRPLQLQAMQCAMEHRDSVVVLPTGGGKSLCYQVPAVCLEGLTVVVSPLISLMKDQVDALTDCGVRAACVHSMIGPDEKRQIAEEIRSGEMRMLYVAPERVVQPRTIEFLKSIPVAQIAVDEAHCISSWGHDFRPEYRQLRLLRKALPGVGMHAYTATATERVRQDVAEQLDLEDAQMLVGDFDRPNLIYRVKRKNRAIDQIRSVIDQHPRAAGIVYCISRKQVEETAATLAATGVRVRPYHAGLDDEIRQRHQSEFAQEEVDVIVATVAFGMGIDKSNVRYVIHSGMPKSLEQYQQESGRAGRDGLEAECLLLYSGGDAALWRRLIEQGAQNQPGAEEGQLGALEALNAMSDFCHSATCRHHSLVAYFGQQLERDNCGACDACLCEIETIDDALTIGQKILSCVLRLEERYGADYTAKVLVGSNDQRIIERGHEKLSTHGLLEELPLRTVRDWTEQLVGQGFLEKSGEYNLLTVTQLGREMLRGELTPRLLKPVKASSSSRSRSTEEGDQWEGVHRELFEELRRLRRDLAHERSVPAYIVFGDQSLRDMARSQPTTLAEFRQVSGVGEKKLSEYGDEFVTCIRQFLSAG